MRWLLTAGILALVALVGVVSCRGGDGVSHLNLEIGPIPSRDLSAAWQQMARAGGFAVDTATVLAVTMTLTTDGSLTELSIQAATGDGRLVDVSGQTLGGQPAEKLRLVGDVTAPGIVQAISPQTVLSGLAALDRSGVEEIIRVVETNRTADFYVFRILVYQEEQRIPADYPAFLWTGSGFRGLMRDDPGRAWDSGKTFVEVLPMAPVGTSIEGVQETATTAVWRSLGPVFFILSS